MYWGGMAAIEVTSEAITLPFLRDCLEHEWRERPKWELKWLFS